MKHVVFEIVERFHIKVKLPIKEREEKWFLDYAFNSPREIGRHVSASWLVLQRLLEEYGPDAFPHVQEFFGGIGAQAAMVDSLFNPVGWHRIQEFNQEAVYHLQKMEIGDEILHTDSYAAEILPGLNLAMMDFGNLTAWRLREGEVIRQLLDRVFAAPQLKAVVLTDIACAYLNMNYPKYEEVLGEGNSRDYPTYLRKVADFIAAQYGYNLLICYHSRKSAVMAFVERDVERPQILHVPDRPIGLKMV